MVLLAVFMTQYCLVFGIERFEQGEDCCVGKIYLREACGWKLWLLCIAETSIKSRDLGPGHITCRSNQTGYETWICFFVDSSL